MKHILIVLALLCALCLHAKDGKIKYGKTVVYEGQIEDKQPKGQGVLNLLGHDQKAYFTIEGFFNGNNITNANIISQRVGGSRTKLDPTTGKYEQVRIKVESVNVIYNDNKNKNYHDIQVILNKLELNLYSRDMGPLYSDCFKSPFKFSIDNLVLHCTNKPGSEYYTNYLGDSIIATISSDNIKQLRPDISSIFHYNNSLVDKVEYIVKINYRQNYRLVLPSLLSNGIPQVFWVMKDGARFDEGTQSITYPNGDKIEYEKNGWTGTRNFSDGTKVTSNKVNVYITKSKGNETYIGSLKNVFAPLYPKSTYAFYTGTQTVNGVTTKWINGETFAARHERLKDKLEPKWLAMVDEGTLSEEEAFKEQKAEIAEKEREIAKKEREEYLKKHPEKKKKYHDVGKMENCSWCAGTGRHLLNSNMICAFCGGKGWYIEHYW